MGIQAKQLMESPRAREQENSLPIWEGCEVFHHSLADANSWR